MLLLSSCLWVNMVLMLGSFNSFLCVVVLMLVNFSLCLFVSFLLSSRFEVEKF